ncbi:MAG TPA: hypothetical protein VF796_13630 [Humisphaera sp.]
MSERLRADQWKELQLLKERIERLLPAVDRLGSVYICQPQISGRLAGDMKRTVAGLEKLLDADVAAERRIAEGVRGQKQ